MIFQIYLKKEIQVPVRMAAQVQRIQRLDKCFSELDIWLKEVCSSLHDGNKLFSPRIAKYKVLVGRRREMHA